MKVYEGMIMGMVPRAIYLSKFPFAADRSLFITWG